VIDVEKLERELLGPHDIKYDSKGNPVAWTSTSRSSDQYRSAVQTIVLARLANAVETLNERLLNGTT
jgi:hypothetical protein